MSSRRAKRGRRAKALAETFDVVEMVFCQRYGLSYFERRFPGDYGGSIGRRPGTVTAYRLEGGRAPAAFYTVQEACRSLEPLLKAGLPQWSVHPKTGAIETWRTRPVVAARRSDGIARQGEAVRQALYRALRIERESRVTIAHQKARDDWNQRLAERRRKQSRQRI